jgi:AraC-like DNA-binding protein
MFAIIRTRWHTRPLSRRAKRRSSAAPGSLRKKYTGIVHPPKHGTLTYPLYHIWGSPEAGIRPPEPLLARLSNLHEAAANLAKNAPDILANPEVARAIEQALIEVMILCLTGGDPVGTRSAHRQHQAVMRRLEGVLEASSGEPLHMTELCRAAGASYRTLRDCCQKHLGMSPKRYLWLRRMHLVCRL